MKQIQILDNVSLFHQGLFALEPPYVNIMCVLLQTKQGHFRCFVKEIMMHCNLDVYGHGCIQMTTPATSLIMTAEEFCHIKADPSLRFRPLWRLHFFQGYFLAQLCNHCCWLTCVMETEDPISNIYVSVYLCMCYNSGCTALRVQAMQCVWAPSVKLWVSWRGL